GRGRGGAGDAGGLPAGAGGGDGAAEREVRRPAEEALGGRVQPARPGPVGGRRDRAGGTAGARRLAAYPEYALLAPSFRMHSRYPWVVHFAFTSCVCKISLHVLMHLHFALLGCPVQTVASDMGTSA